MNSHRLLIAIPKGRILPKALDMLAELGIHVDVTQIQARKLLIDTNIKGLYITIIRNSDILVSICNGACDIAVAGSDQLAEFENVTSSYYDLFDLQIAKCKLQVAARSGYTRSNKRVRVASKFVHLAKKYYAMHGIQTEIVALHGAMELAIHIDLADEIVDLVETGQTLRENGLLPIDTIMSVSSHLIANCDSLITKHKHMHMLLDRFVPLFGHAKVLASSE